MLETINWKHVKLLYLYWPVDRVFNTRTWTWAIFIKYLRVGRWAAASGAGREWLLPGALGHVCGLWLQCKKVKKELTRHPLPTFPIYKANAKQMSSKAGKMKWKAHLGFIELKTKNQWKLGLWWAQSLPLIHNFFHHSTCKLASRCPSSQQETGGWCGLNLITWWVWARHSKPFRIWQEPVRPWPPLPCTLAAPSLQHCHSWPRHSVAYSSSIPHSLAYASLISPLANIPILDPPHSVAFSSLTSHSVAHPSSIYPLCGIPILDPPTI